MASPATAGKPFLHVSAVFQFSRSLFLQMGTFKLRVRRNIDSPESAAPVHAVAAAAAPAAVAAAAPAAAAAPYVSMDEPPYESIDEAHVYVTVPKVRFGIWDIAGVVGNLISCHHPCGTVNPRRAPTPGFGCHTGCPVITQACTCTTYRALPASRQSSIVPVHKGGAPLPDLTYCYCSCYLKKQHGSNWWYTLLLFLHLNFFATK